LKLKPELDAHLISQEMVVGEIERIPGIRKKMHKFSNAAMI
jgi:hypothetical protein